MTLVLPFVAGQKLRASQLTAMVTAINVQATAYAARTTNATSVNNTLTDDTQIVFTGLTASAVYRMQSELGYTNALATADFLVGWSCSGTGATLVWSQHGLDQTQTATNGGEAHQQLSLAQASSYGTIAGGSAQVATPSGFLFTGTGTSITFKLRWSQATTDAGNATTLLAGSAVTLIRVQ